MVRTFLASRQTLMTKSALVAGVLLIASAATSPAMAASAANASDSFRVNPEDVKANQTALGLSDPDFRAIHDSWGLSKGAPAKVSFAIPSSNPVELMALSSNFGPRRSPIRGASRNHKGMDIPGPVGTPIYATADGTIGRAQWVSGYGKYVEIEHGNAIETRYGHMSALNVSSGQRVRKGDIIGYMGSTGRSTGSHLHYEVRVGGEAVNPAAFLAPSVRSPEQANRLLAAKQIDITASGGPAK
jgi:murein DD-endopeptidase MepM/ murein hydrolase activator NlpD